MGFVQTRIRSNPVITRILRKPSRLTSVWWLIGIVSLCSFIGSLFDIHHANIPVFGIVILGMAMILINPILAMLTAIEVTGATIITKSQEYGLVCATGLSDMKLIEGHIFAAFYRFRVPLVLMLGLIPSVVVYLMHGVYDAYIWCSQTQPDCLLPNKTVIFHWILFYGISILDVIGRIALGIVASIALVNWSKSQLEARLGMVMLTVLFLCKLPQILYSASARDPIATLFPLFVYTVIIYLIVVIVVFAGQSFARQPD